MSGTHTTVSLNEIGFYITRAAVGVGVPFGVAEDFATAVRWSVCFGIDPAIVALSCLTALDLDPSLGRIKLLGSREWHTIRGEGGTSVVFAGISMTEIWQGVALPQNRLTVLSIDYPLLALAYAAFADGRPVKIEWPGVHAVLDGVGGIVIQAVDLEALQTRGSVDVMLTAPVSGLANSGDLHITSSDIDAANHRLLCNGVALDAPAWAGIVELFRRCLVPSNEQSRLAGAGAGLVDTD